MIMMIVYIDLLTNCIYVMMYYCTGRDTYPIPVYNSINKYACQPPQFRYLSTHIYVDSPSNKYSSVPFPCLVASDDCCDGKKCTQYKACKSLNCHCCSKTTTTILQYGRLSYGVSYLCHANCTCFATCGNRLSSGSSVKCHIVYDDCRGYIVISDKSITKDEYVFEYVGEVLPAAVAEQRINLYNNVGKLSYQTLHKQYRIVEDAPLTLNDIKSLHHPRFIIELVDHHTSATIAYVDGFRLGNIGRYLQHVCSGNLRVQLVYNLPNSPVPRICFFALRDIDIGEELCISHDPYDCMQQHTYPFTQYNAGKLRLFVNQPPAHKTTANNTEIKQNTTI